MEQIEIRIVYLVFATLKSGGVTFESALLHKYFSKCSTNYWIDFTKQEK